MRFYSQLIYKQSHNYLHEISKYCCLFYNSTCSLIYSIIARKRTSSDQFNQSNSSVTTRPKHESHCSGINESKYLELKDTLTKAKLAIIDGHLLEALTDVRNVETQLLLIEPSPTKFLSDMHKAVYAIARADIDKSLDTLTKIQLDILKAENQIFKAAVANPQLMQQFDTAGPNTDDEGYSIDTEGYSTGIDDT